MTHDTPHCDHGVPVGWQCRDCESPAANEYRKALEEIRALVIGSSDPPRGILAVIESITRQALAQPGREARP